MSVAHVIDGQHNCINITATRAQHQVLAVFNPRGMVHFPRTSNMQRCRCGKIEHGEFRGVCDISEMQHLGNAPFPPY
jgi:hypothetical protein